MKSSSIYQELIQYQKEGIALWLDGRPSTSYRIADKVREQSDYMRDYYMDCKNQICGIGFDLIRKDNHHQTAQSPCAQNLNKYEDFLKKSKYVRSKQ